MGRNDDQIRCSFCNKSQAQVKKLIAGPNDTYICDECVEVCSEIIEEEMAYDENDSWTPFSDINLLKPEEIKEFLDDYVIGQDEAKRFFLLLYIITTSVLWHREISASN